MLPRFRTLLHLHHAKGRTFGMLHAQETLGLRNYSFSLQHRFKREEEFDFSRRLEGVETEVHPRFRRSKIPGWFALVVGGLVGVGIYEGIKILISKGRHEKLKEYALAYQMKMQRRTIDRETNSQKYYWILLQKVKSKYEEILHLQLKTLKEFRKLRLQIAKCKYDDRNTRIDLLTKWLEVCEKYAAQLAAIIKSLEKEMKYYNGAQIVYLIDLLKVLYDEFLLKPPVSPNVKEFIENDRVILNVIKKLE